jgi:hypothetical protein
MFPIPLTSLYVVRVVRLHIIWVSQYDRYLYSTLDLRSWISSLRPLLHPLYVLLHHPSLDEQNSEAMDNSCLHGLFTLPPGEDVDLVQQLRQTHRSTPRQATTRG